MDKVYAPYLDGKSKLNIIDAGCNIGLFSFYAHPFAERIIAIEPSKEHFAVMNHMFQFNKLENIIPLNVALSHEKGKGVLHHNNNVTMYSLSELVQDPSLEAEEVDMLTIEEIMNENGMDKVDFLKLDVEGVEAEILCGESFEKVAPRINALVYEWHAWSGRNPTQINNALADYGYTVKQIPSEATIFGAVRND